MYHWFNYPASFRSFDTNLAVPSIVTWQPTEAVKLRQQPLRCMNNESIVWCVSLAGRALSTRIERGLASHGIGREEYRVLFGLYNEEVVSRRPLPKNITWTRVSSPASSAGSKRKATSSAVLTPRTSAGSYCISPTRPKNSVTR